MGGEDNGGFTSTDCSGAHPRIAARMNPSPPASATAGTGPITVGAVLAGRYRVTARVGAGGMATIYRATDESLDRAVAVKVLHSHLADDASLHARFRAEGRAAAGLLHPNIVNVFDQGVAQLPYIVMEYVDGPSLREVLLTRGRLTPREVLAIAEPVCQALTRAHAAGLVHRDIKPENVLIAADGTVKVADFGIARAIAETSHTATGTLVGSVHYLAPELMQGAAATDRSDQYALGVVLFELLTGRKPLPAETPMAVAMRHAREPIPSVRQFVSDTPRAVDAVIAQATAADPRRRFADLASLMTDLRKAVPGGPAPVIVEAPEATDGTLVIRVDAQDTIAVPHTTRGKRRRAPKLRRRRWPLALALAVLLSTGGGFAGWNWLLAPVNAAPALVERSEEDARAAAEDAGFGFEVAAERPSVTVPEGFVLTQDPAAGAPLRRRQPVAVVLSSGPDDVTLPGVVGDRAQKAAQRLEQPPLHLRAKLVDVFSDDVPKGRVVSQKPAAEATVAQGGTVTLRVSQGIEQVEVPKVVGLNHQAAAAKIEAARLRFTVQNTYSDTYAEKGTVAAQSVEAGATVDKGTTVTLTVSAGPATVTLPNHVGQGLEQARGALAGLGLNVRVIEQQRPLIGPFRRGEFGRVEAQSPTAGTRLKRGEAVDLYTFSRAAEQEADG
ncbi:MAG: Stk1 family PASTA domain-containing Ser/Thr kinase [Nitriliruptorales bacterium]|nr:Stk1 family PASTA domain-containing Ser/Thr kinase [Nitriliruptorales bacterium]